MSHKGGHDVYATIWKLLEAGAPELVTHIRTQPANAFVHELFNEKVEPDRLEQIGRLLHKYAKNDADWGGEIPDPKSSRILRAKKSDRKGRHPMTMGWCFEIPKAA